MFQRILVPLDGSALAEQVLPYVRIIGKALKSRIELLGVFEPIPDQWADPAHGRYTDRLATGFRDETKDYLEKAAVTIRAGGLTVTCSAHEGNPAENILTEAGKEPDTLVAMSTHGRSGITRWVMGSVTDKVLHASSTPMLIVRAQEEPTNVLELRNAIAPLDGSPLSEQVLAHIVPLAKALGLTVNLAQAVPGGVERYTVVDYPARYDQMLQEYLAQAEGYLRRMHQQLSIEGVAQVRDQITQSNPASAIIEIAHETPSSLIAMMTHGRSGLGRWALGSITDRVVRHSGVPVLVIRATS